MSTNDTTVNKRDRRIPRVLTVKSATNITPNMRRVTLHGDDLNDFPPISEGAYIKLLFDQTEGEKPVMRTYTLSEQRSASNEIDIDFMMHTDNNGTTHGYAAPWAISTQPGDSISLFGPGPAKFINTEAEHFLLAADMTALPALTANLKLLPSNAHGKAFIEILSDADKQDLPKPQNIEIIWVINDSPGSDESPLFHAIEDANIKDGPLAVWVACEFKTMKKIRQYLKQDIAVEKSHLYVSSYWKKGITEEEHKVAKQADAEDA